MTQTESIPAWAMEMARKAQDDAIAACKERGFAYVEYPFPTGHSKETLDEFFARALMSLNVAAEARGMERAAKLVDAEVESADAEQRQPDCTAKEGWMFACVHSALTRTSKAIRAEKDQL